MTRRLGALATLLLTTGGLVALPDAARVQAAGQPLEFSGTISYAADPAAGLIHVTIDIDVKDIATDQPAGTCYEGYYVPVPAGSGNFRNQQAAYSSAGALGAYADQPVQFAAYDGITDFVRMQVTTATCMVPGDRSHTVLTYDIPGAASRAANNARSNPAFVGFDAIGMGQATNVAIVARIPEGFTVEPLAEQWQKSVDGTTTVYTLPAPSDPKAVSAYVSARNDSALGTQAVTTAAGLQFELQPWPTDAEWVTFITAQLESGVPALVELIGQPWPIAEPVTVREAFTMYVYGYAGWFSAKDRTIEVGERLDQAVVLHELSHAWFNDGWFHERWLSEGFAQEYAALAVQQLGGTPPTPSAPPNTDPGYIALNEWADPDSLTNGSSAREAYGYATSYAVIAALTDEIGVDAMREVLAAVAAGSTAYPGNQEPESWNPTTDWRHFLDLLENVGGSQRARDLFTAFVVNATDLQSLTDRATAGAAYQDLAERGDQWAPPAVVRHAMDGWDFATAATEIADANSVLDQRDQLQATLQALDMTMPTALQTAYEASEGPLASVAAEFDDAQRTAEMIADATRRLDDPRTPMQKLGLLGTDLDKILAEARAAFEAGDMATARAKAQEAVDGLDNATRDGLIRVAAVSGALLVLGAAIWVIVRRRRSHRLEGADTEPSDDTLVDDGNTGES